MTYLKKRLKALKLHRRGINVQYSHVSQVQAAIEVRVHHVVVSISAGLFYFIGRVTYVDVTVI